MKTAHRLEHISEYYFARKLQAIDVMNKAGHNVINLGIGSPDLPPHPSVINELFKQAELPGSHGYQSYRGSIVLRGALSDWYNRKYNVHLDPESEILVLLGSKEGIVHLCMTYLNDGDEVLVPNPGYPTYRSAVSLAGGRIVEYTLNESNNYAPDFEAISRMDLSRVKMMWLNYPHMPTGALPGEELFNEAVSFARENNILLCHDNPYSFILNDKPVSILSAPGAMDCAVELNSLSKSHNMAGWRVGMLAGSSSRINDVLRFKSNMDSGMFLPVQLAAAKALALPDSWYEEVNAVYKSRKNKAVHLASQLGCSVSSGQAGMFVWARIPDSYKDCYEIADAVLEKAGVFIVPGSIFGSAGERHIRISLCSPSEKFDTAIQRIESRL